MAARSENWQPPPPPTPRIIQLPRLSRRYRTANVLSPAAPGRNLAALLDQERRVKTAPVMVVETSLSSSSRENVGDSGSEERWRFQAEILRAECNYLRMERELALKKLDKHRGQMETALRSAKETLVSGRRKIDGSESIAAALDAEIEELEEKLGVMKLRSKSRRKNGFKIRELKKSCRGNFDQQASVIRRRIVHMEEEAEEADTSVKDIQEIAAPALATKVEPEEDHEAKAALQSYESCRFSDVEILKRKMEGLSKGMLERMEECSHLLSANTAAKSSSSSSSSSKTSGSEGVIGYTETAADKAHNYHMQQQEKEVEGKMGMLITCCNCKEVVGRIMQQVWAETEQWSEMQKMLDQVRVEMEDLRSSRQIWQQRAVASEINFHSLHTQMLEWKQRARSSEQKAHELQKMVSKLQEELQHLKAKLSNPSSASLELELCDADQPRTKRQQHKSLDSLKLEKEKRTLVCRLKSRSSSIHKRPPLQDIRNLPPLLQLGDLSAADQEFYLQ